MSTKEALRFKRRKTTLAKRLPSASVSESHDVAEYTDALKDVLRNRKRPRPRDEGPKAETAGLQAPVSADRPKQSAYESRFVAQTGEVIHRNDQQMTEYVEARLAEKNHRLYGWPVPKHLEATVAALALENAPTDRSPGADKHSIPQQNGQVSAGQSNRLAAGMGKLEEVDLSIGAASQRTEHTAKARLHRDGKPRRAPKRRNSEDLRRDQMVDDVLREAKLDYFEEDKLADPSAAGEANNDDAMVEKFRMEFLESLETRQQRKPTAATGAKGAKDVPKGPKLGGSRSARAAMRLQEEQAAKSKR
ncbi:hypothetical protein CC80DRAFT_555479 [Byssothecium circinans]|uniref:Hepatocellular carcinoma-associated antigen 59-domain-containing protein n=1 Tax=Byssothecium circinans TaxID=147558 RepID=A0A6A5T9M2_9PLEO|nr:hypothetical protein CC80DRAFT_555479 [Byssothecium circinans]